MYITINNQSIYYQKIGKGKNLILLPGWGNDSSSFWGIVDDLKESFTLYLIDLPGFGRSETPKKPFRGKDYAEIIKKFINQLEITDPIVLGHSVGGRIAIKLAANNPNLLNKLILEDAAGIKPQKSFKKAVFGLIAKVFKVVIPNTFNLKEKLRVKFYTSIQSDYLTVGDLKQTFINLINEDLTKDLKKIKTETLLIWGEKDNLAESTLNSGKKMYRLIENSRIEVLDDVGHFPHLDNKERFVYYVKDFC